MKPFNKEEYNKLCVEFLGYVNTTPTDKDFNIYKHPTTNQMIETNFDSRFIDDWNSIHKIIEKIESLDESKNHYQWKDIDGSTRTNFNGYSVDIEGNECFIWLNLELDPPEILGEIGRAHV